MYIKTILDNLNHIEKEISKDVFGAMRSQELIEETNKIQAIFEECTDRAAKTLLASVDETTLVRFLLMVQKANVSAMMANGEETMFAVDIRAQKELQKYTQSVILSTIGILISDEIL